MNFWDIVLTLCIMGVLALAVRRLMRVGNPCSCESCSLAGSCHQGGSCESSGRMR